MVRISCIVFSILMLFCAETYAQSFGGNPWNLKWQQLESDNIRIIFPDGYEQRARRVFSMLNYIEGYQRETVGDKTDRISIVLNNRTNISNGYVGLAPFRSEFFTNPLQNNFALGSTPWLDLLSIHEYRHVLQFSNARRGFSKLMSVLFGSAAFAGSMNLAVPDWYLEGDAVMAETAMTNQGRGRIPAFLRGYKAYELAGQRFSYQKVRNGSYKDFIPDHYRLGYMINKFGADQNGSEFWAGVLADAGKFKGIIRPFSNAIRRRTGLSTAGIYTESFDAFKDQWTSNQPKSATVADIVIPHTNKTFTNYRIPRIHKDSSLYFIKSGLRDIAEIHRVQDGERSKVVALGQGTDLYYDLSGDKLVWSELRFHPLRNNVDYSVLMLYNTTKKEKIQLTQGTRLFSPTLHPDGQVIAAIDIDIDGYSRIALYSSRDGLKVDSLANAAGYFITYPQWSPDAQKIYFAARDDDGRMAICEQDVADHSIRAITPWTHRSIGIPQVTAEHVYYSRSATDAEHIYRVHIQDQVEELVIQSTLGAYQPVMRDDHILYAGYTKDGFRIMQSEIRPEPAEKVEAPQDATYALYGSDISDQFTITDAPAKNYGRLSRPINIHSWGFTADDETVAFAIESDNILNSISLAGGLQYIFNDDRFIYSAAARFGFTYPLINLSYNLEARSFLDDDSNVINFDEHTVGIGVSAPLNLSSGVYSRTLQPQFSLEKIFILGPQIDLEIFSQQMGFAFLNRRITAPQNVIAPWSQWISINLRSSLDDFKANQFDLETEISFPGLMKNHALRIEIDYAKQPRDADYNFGNRFDFARGYPSVGYNQASRIGVNYHLPLVYPDFGIDGIVYLKRIQGNLFYDQSRLSLTQQKVDLNAYGGELLFDCRWLNSLDFSFGVRYAYLQHADAFTNPLNEHQFEVFVPFYRF